MTISRSVWISVLLATSLAACTKPDATDATPAAMPTTASGEAATPAPAPVVMVFNAYTSNILNQNGEAGEPTRIFKSGEKIYIGAVLHGDAASVVVKAEWFDGDEKSLGSAETTLAAKTATVATVELVQPTPLAVGTYKALVYLNGAPSWELLFEISP